MLPLHGQSTAAVKKYIHRAGSTPHSLLSGGDVFGKQARPYLPSSFSLLMVCFFFCVDMTVTSYFFSTSYG